MSRAHVVSPLELQSLRDLELVTKATVEGLRQGLHRSPFHGYSAEFSQYRHYRPGDDLKYIDWKAFGRTDRLYTRQFRETTNLSALFIVDSSRSMDFDGKFDLARAVAGILGKLVLDQGDAAGLLAVDARTHYVPPRSGHHHLSVYLKAISSLTPSGAEGVAGVVRRTAAVMKRRGVVFVLSDLYEDAAVAGDVRRLAKMGHDVVVVHTLSARELSLDVGGAAEMVDMESGRRLVVQPSEARDRYVSAVTTWMAGVERDLRRSGIEYLRLIAGEPIEPALRRFLMHRRGGA